MVELVINQLVAHEVEEGSIVSVSLPPDAAGAIIRALSAGISVALQQRRLTKYN